MTNTKAWKIANYILYGLLIIGVTYLGYVGYNFIQREVQLSELKNQILQIEAQVEINKQNWSYCANNMQLWNDDNNKNREMITNLKKQYNDMIFKTDVGFTRASTSDIPLE